MKLIYMLHT